MTKFNWDRVQKENQFFRNANKTKSSFDDDYSSIASGSKKEIRQKLEKAFRERPVYCYTCKCHIKPENYRRHLLKVHKYDRETAESLVGVEMFLRR